MISRHLFRDLRPLFRMFDEPLTRSPAYWGAAHDRTNPLEHPFFGARSGLRPAVDITDEGKNYVLEAELPGVKKEDVDVHIGDNGRSITIEGKVFTRTNQPRPTSEPDSAESSTSGPTTETAATIYAEREFTGNTSFARTITLPERVDSRNVTAKLADGLLVVTVPKLEDEVSRVTVNVN